MLYEPCEDPYQIIRTSGELMNSFLTDWRTHLTSHEGQMFFWNRLDEADRVFDEFKAEIGLE